MSFRHDQTGERGEMGGGEEGGWGAGKASRLKTVRVAHEPGHRIVCVDSIPEVGCLFVRPTHRFSPDSPTG